MKNSIIGYTGFIGKNLIRQTNFSYFFNTKNINQIHKKKYNLTFVCAPHAKKWWANKYPKKDTYIVNKLINNLKKIKTKKIILISTIDVYDQKILLDEDSTIDIHKSNIYGKNRLKVEKFIENNFKDHHIIRLPALYGKFLKKNILYDLLNDNNLADIRVKSKFQWYFVGNLMLDIKRVIRNNIKKINFFTEPISTLEIVDLFFKEKKIFLNKKNLGITYDLKTKYSQTFKGKNGYILNKKDNLRKIREFIKNEIINI